MILGTRVTLRYLQKVDGLDFNMAHQQAVKSLIELNPPQAVTGMRGSDDDQTASSS